MSRILLAEDNHINQLVATQMLEQLGHDVRLAKNGIEAVDIASAESFDLIIMDCQMPEMDGYEATKKIKEMQKAGDIKNTPIVAFTAHAMEGDREKCEEAGMDDYLSKPVNEDQLIAMISKWSIATDMMEGAEDEPKNEPSKYKYLDETTIKNLHDLMGDSFKDLMAAFKTNIEKLIADMGEAVSNGDDNMLSKLAHTVKSPAAQVGAAKLSEAAKELEVNATKNSLDENAESVLKIQDAYNASIKEIDAYTF